MLTFYSLYYLSFALAILPTSATRVPISVSVETSDKVDEIEGASGDTTALSKKIDETASALQEEITRAEEAEDNLREAIPTKVTDLSDAEEYATKEWVEDNFSGSGDGTGGGIESINIKETGSGNAYTSATASGSTITLTKGETFVDTTSTQTVTGEKNFGKISASELWIPADDGGYRKFYWKTSGNDA